MRLEGCEAMDQAKDRGRERRSRLRSAGSAIFWCLLACLAVSTLCVATADAGTLKNSKDLAGKDHFRADMEMWNGT